FPDYYDGKLFIYDFMRDWVLAVSMYENGDLEKIEPFLPDLKLSSPVDMEFGPDGALYILEYGTRWFARNQDARLIRIDYAEGNRAPVAEITASKTIGAAPMEVNLSADASFDYDEDDELTYVWTFPEGAQKEGLAVSHTFAEAGSYEVSLQVRDEAGAFGERKINLQVGNEPPVIKTQLRGNKTFFWRESPLTYEIEVEDLEDGSLAAGSLPEGSVAISFDYLNGSEDPTIQAQDHAALANASIVAAGKELVQTYGCIACHAVNQKIQGPSYQEVSERYQDREDNIAYISNKIRNGGNGLWGGNAMPAQTQVSEEDARKIAIYLLSLASEEPLPPSLARQGRLNMDEHRGLGQGSRYMLQISYQDQGGDEVGPLSVYDSYTFRSPRVSLQQMDQIRSKNARMRNLREQNIRYGQLRSDAVVVLPEFDLSTIEQIALRYRTELEDVSLEVHADAVDGPLLGIFSPTQTGQTFREADITLQSMEGIHDVYLVLTNNGGAEGNAEVLGIEWLYVYPPKP
ncbi:MAG: PKD domain-containing protein, partial [Bacteroidota bacterium]